MRKDTQLTRQKLVDAAEKLFAEKGLESTSLFDVLKASGVKNRSALQYHFKDKAGLINAVLNKHSGVIAEYRSTLIDQLQKEEQWTLHQAVDVIVAPLAEKLSPESGGREFLKIHSQLMVSEQYSQLRLQRPELRAEARRIQSLLAPFVKDISEQSIHARFALIDCLLIHGLARYFYTEEAVSRQFFHQTLVQSIVDIISQPEPKFNNI
ncbi:TetR/AcrR family transcriptional regulator [Endozoicomonas atrinae]|uniref:TetR/AcrR family transcriptional regulator n=1 Tax=Endozoicomonas atrinae TaxID=1333660 RepID=UPI0008271DAB|nr:TetR family transcriptional regulator [Endozoicomonas atrinae]